MTMRHASALQQLCMCDAKAKTADPTGTADIRRRFKSAIEMRWRKMRAQLRMCMVNQDMLSLNKNGTLTPLAMAMQAMPQDSRLVAFQTWVDKTLADVVLEHDSVYLDDAFAVAYRRAVARALRLTGYTTQPANATGKIRAIQQAVHVELQGVIEAASQNIMRIAASAILDGMTPAEAFNATVQAIDKIGIVRSRALIETYVVKAHATGTLDTYEANGVSKVVPVPESIPAVKRFADAKRVRIVKKKTGAGSRTSREKTPSKSTIARIRREQRALEQRLQSVEILTAGDDDVCPICEDIAEQGPYTINTARSLIPAHPNCRCSWVPADDARFAPIIEKEEDEDD